MRVFILCLIGLLSGFNLKAQEVKKLTLIESENIGKIVFLNKPLTLEQISPDDLINTFDLKQNEHLDARIFMSNSLTDYLHEIDTNSPVEQLVKNGNYRFSFYVDDVLIYTENLHPGAGTLQSKSSWTSLRIPLIGSSEEDHWGRFLWGRFYFGNGGEDALFGGKHILKIEVQPYLLCGNDIKTGNIIASGEINFLTPEIPVTKEQISIQQIQSGSDWELSEDKFNPELIEELNTKIVQERFKNITSLVVIKEGKLMLEEYFNGSGRDTKHDTRSVGKSFASTLTGMAIQEGYIQNEDVLLGQFYNLLNYKNYIKAKDSITLKSLLTMSSSFDGSDADPDSPGNEENMYPTDNWVKFALDLSLDSDKKNGKQWDYFTAGVVLIGDILNQKVPGGLEVYSEEKLFIPLGIKNYKWQYTPQKVVNTAGGLALRSLDLAKYGQLYQARGKWNGKHLLSET